MRRSCQVVDEYFGFDLGYETGAVKGRPWDREVWIHAFKGSAWVFDVHLIGRHRAFSGSEPEAVERRLVETGLHWIKGLLSLGRYSTGEQILVELADEAEADISADSEISDPVLEFELLRALQRMDRAYQSTSTVGRLDVRGVAYALRVDPERVVAAMRDLMALGQVEPHAQTMGNLAQDGAARITGPGILRLRTAAAELAQEGDAWRTSTWQAVVSEVEPALARAALGDFIAQVHGGMKAGNRAGWQSTLYACRSILEGVANYLWQDPRPSYDKLPGTREGHLDVSYGRYMNRMGAYLNERVESSTTRALLRNEGERLWQSLDSLSNLDSKAHDFEITQDDARFAVVSTYLLLGELFRRTGFEPVTGYR